MPIFISAKGATGALRGGAIAAAALLMLAVTALNAPAQTLSADCERLRQSIADASRNSQSAQFQAAAERQRGEIDRTVAYMRSIGCDNRRFLFFGSEPPPQCGTLTQQVSRMRANLDDLQARAGGGSGGRGELIARYNSQCNGGRPGTLDAVFGDPNRDMTQQPLNPDGSLDQTVNPGEAHAGSKAVCVRTCDGSFFPVSYSASGGRLDSLEDMCRALCPNTDVALFTYPASGEIEQAVSSTGQRYLDSPNALKYRQTYDPSCSCRKRGQTWADALSNAESKLGRENRSDIIVTPEKAAELSRPKLPDAKPDPKAVDSKGKPIKGKATPSAPPTANAGGTDVNGVDTTLSQQAATVSRETTGIAAPTDAQVKSTVGEGQGQTVEVTGPDGVKRRVRVVGPTL